MLQPGLRITPTERKECTVQYRPTEVPLLRTVASRSCADAVCAGCVCAGCVCGADHFRALSGPASSLLPSPTICCVLLSIFIAGPPDRRLLRVSLARRLRRQPVGPNQAFTCLTISIRKLSNSAVLHCLTETSARKNDCPAFSIGDS